MLDYLESLKLSSKVHVWRFTRSDESPNFREINEAVISAALASLEPDIFLVSSFIEGFHSQSQTHLPEGSHKNLVIVYDLIPSKFPNMYLSDDLYRSWYKAKLETLRRADLLLCISEATKSDLVDILNVDERKTLVIGAGVNAQRFAPATTRQTLDSTPYFVYSGGGDWRKNLEGLILGFSLSQSIRRGLRLKVVCQLTDVEKARLMRLAGAQGVPKGSIEFTGYLDDRDYVQVTRDAKFCIFPSLYEGFGLPVLEALSLSKAVICSSTSSMVEVQRDERAWFDPASPSSIGLKIDDVNLDDKFRVSLELQALKLAKHFSWERTIKKFKLGLPQSTSPTTLSQILDMTAKPKLALVTPMPPTKSGIAFYAERLASELSKYYEITIVNPQLLLQQDENKAFGHKSVEWFLTQAQSFDRIVYQIGNSQFHSQVLEILSKFPGVAVFHEFNIGGLVQHMQVLEKKTHVWDWALLNSGGYPLIVEMERLGASGDFVSKQVSNLGPLQNALAIAFHSQTALESFEATYEFRKKPDLVAVFPLVSSNENYFAAANQAALRTTSRNRLGLGAGTKLICSFGFVTRHKAIPQIIRAVQILIEAGAKNIKFVNVGETDKGLLGRQIQQEIRNLKLERVVEITGWVNTEMYLDYLSASDVVLQFRQEGLGEMSAALMDAVSARKPVVVNDSLVPESFDERHLKIIRDDCEPSEIATAVSTLLNDEPFAEELASAAKLQASETNSLKTLASKYFDFIEQVYRSQASAELSSLVRTSQAIGSTELATLARKIGQYYEPLPRIRQVFIDVTLINRSDEGTGIQRVVRSLTQELLKEQRSIGNVWPVYFDESLGRYCHAGQFAGKITQTIFSEANKSIIEGWPGDLFVSLDFNPYNLEKRRIELEILKSQGVSISTVVYDLLPLEHPEFFHIGAKEGFENWLLLTSRFDGVICISKVVAEAYTAWLEMCPNFHRPKVSVFPLGSDFLNRRNERSSWKVNPTLFLMVGTLEPRKGHRYVIEEFEKLWDEGEKATLTIVGKQGWLTKETVKKIRNHPQLGAQLHWHEDLGDRELAELYLRSRALIAASYAEGYGLPILEATSFGLPVIARQIAIFEEVAPPGTTYFSELGGKTLHACIIEVLSSQKEHTEAIVGEELVIPTWENSATELLLQIQALSEK